MTPSRPLQSGVPSPPKPMAPAPIAPDHVSVLGIPLAMTDYEATMDWIDATVAHRQKGYICVAATHTVMVCDEDPELREAVLNASLTLPDGQPLVWAMNALGGDLEDRVYGPELMARYCDRAAASGTRMYLYGGRNQGALVQLALNLRQRFAGVKIVGGYSPPYRDLSEEEEDAIVAEMNASNADVVWVGVGAPKQEKWMAAMRERLDAPVLVGVGAAFDFHAGLVPQAPEWMQSAGLEWLFRMAQEPRRLAPRYVRYNPRFITGFARQYVRHRMMGDTPER
ncbi:MAG: WecB/TagA/CpsF family glycosyltransferase [Actinobacteria bacterium]|nr:WecB/TagA/CpsF family glycosyltransferase [Actinomycetota bacterium]